MRPLKKGKKEERDRDKLGDRLEALLERKKEEDEATCLMEEMRRNVEVAEHESSEAEQNLCSALREYADTFDKDHGRPKTAVTKLRQLMQSRDTTNLNLDLEEILAKMKQMGWSDDDTTGTWTQSEGDDQ